MGAEKRHRTVRGMGKQEANIYEIAREAGVSIATVSRVINHSNAVSEKSYRRVMDAVRAAKNIRPVFLFLGLFVLPLPF